VNIGTEFPDLGTLVAVIARSQIMVARPATDRRPIAERGLLPSGFGEVDVAVLEWIAAEGGRVGRAIARL
jgi:hypothetical protein